MANLPLAFAPELVYLAAAVAVALLLALHFRLQQRVRTMDLDVERLKKTQKDGALDARARLEEATATLGTLEALEPQVEDVRQRLDAIQGDVQRFGEAEAALTDATARAERAEEVACGTSERFGEVDERLKDAQQRVLQAERSLDHLKGALDERLAAIERRLQAIDGALERGTAETLAAPPVPGATRRSADRPAPVVETEPDDGGPGRWGVEDDGEMVRVSGGDDATDRPGTALEARWVILVVIGLAGLSMLLHWMGVGR